ncbi:MAG: hypothetical protein NC299_00755 [Lachnospiraceae bacterium]|nr:hypothetical protein [Ruminococcus sp.]MCM1273877.1 hypothetical protein [Lachnospiraceae bacterium]
MFSKRLLFASAILSALLAGCAEGGAVVFEARLSEGGTKIVGYHDLERIPEGAPYGAIIKALGETESFGYSGYRQYLTFDGRLIQLRFDGSDDVCPYSGAELYGSALPLWNEKRIGLAIVTDDEILHVTYFAQRPLTGELYLTDAILVVGDTTRITRENGFKVSKEDFAEAGSAVRFEAQTEAYSDPPMVHCTKVTVVDTDLPEVVPPYDETLSDGSVKTFYPDGVTVTKFTDGGVETFLPYSGGGKVEYEPPEGSFGKPYRETAVISRDELAEIPGSIPYCKILETLGETNAFGNPRYRQYITDDGRLVQLWFDNVNALCPYSGAELYARALPISCDGDIPEGMRYGVLTLSGDFVYGAGSLSGASLLTGDAELVFSDGSPAAESDLKPETAALVKYDYALYGSPEQWHCTKIIILG